MGGLSVPSLLIYLKIIFTKDPFPTVISTDVRDIYFFEVNSRCNSKKPHNIKKNSCLLHQKCKPIFLFKKSPKKG